MADSSSTSQITTGTVATSQRPELVLEKLAVSLMQDASDLADVFGSPSLQSHNPGVNARRGGSPIADAYQDFPKQNPTVNRVTEDIKTHLFLKTSRSLMLGDSHEINCINGSLSDCRIVFSPPTLETTKVSAKVSTKAPSQFDTQDVEAANNEAPAPSQTIFSISGIARDLKLKANKFYDQPNEQNTSIVPSSTLALPSILSVDFAYGAITFLSSKKIVKLDFLSKTDLPTYNNPADLAYANLSVVTDKRMGTEAVVLPTNAAVQVQDGEGGAQVATFPIGNLEPIVLPGVVQGDPAFNDQSGVNIISYRKGLGRLNYMWFFGVSKSVNLANDHHRIVYCSLQKTTDLFSPLIYEGTYTAFSANNYTRLLNSSQNFFGMDCGNPVSGVKLTNHTDVMTCDISNNYTEIRSLTGCSSDMLAGSKMVSKPLALTRAENLAMRAMLEDGTAQSVVQSYQFKTETAGTRTVNASTSLDATDSSVTDSWTSYI